MCGIFGIIGSKKSELGKHLLKGIKRLEYRGYDSVGAVAKDGSIIQIRKAVGTVDEVEKKVKISGLRGSIGLVHSRWSTTGGVVDSNAHPHQSYNKKLTLIHNGIIENYTEIKNKLIKKGFKFKSKTDTEVAANYLEDKLDQGKSIKQALLDSFDELEGTFSFLIINNTDDKIFALRKDSPLVLGLCKGYNILASDIYAFSDVTDKAIFFDNLEIAEISKDSYKFYNNKGNPIKKNIQTFNWDQEESLIKEYPHYMIKEIMEEPKVVKRLLFSLSTEQKEILAKFIKLIKDAKKIYFIACGTSYHASLLGVYYLHKCGIQSQTLIGSEFKHFATIDKDTLVIPISQSGETMDIIDALKYVKAQRGKIVSIVNVPYSTIQRMSEVSLNILAGQEVCVAATKSFVNQVTLLLAISKRFGYKINLDNIPGRIESVLEQKEKIKKIAKKIYRAKDIYVLGRGLSYPVAREMALKIKEISYIHAEGMMGGELKHGTLALIEKGVPVICLISNKDLSMVANTNEVKARDATVIQIANEYESAVDIKTSNDGKFGILATIVGQLLTYYMALELKLPIDKPRNLAKVCTTL